MVTFLSFSKLGSLLTYLNIIFIGVVVHWATNRFHYLINVIIYAIAKTFIPIITTLIFGSLLNIATTTLGIGTIFILLILYFILGLIVIKIIEKITAYFDYDTILYFITIFSIIDSIVILFFSLIINLFF